jgi:transposase InsO family protein
VFVERVWRSIKYEEVYLKAYESVSHARRSIGEYVNLYNQKRPHSSLADQTLRLSELPRPPLFVAWREFTDQAQNPSSGC